MSPKDIKVGETYRNRGAGKTRRTVVDIGTHIEATWHSPNARPDEPVVLYEQKGTEGRLYLSSFAQWAGCQVEYV